MGERTSYPPGTFCWTELATSDAEAARAFYGALFAWEQDDLPALEGVYTLLRVGGRDVCGLYQTDQAPPAWLSFVSVDDADATTARAAELGGSVPMSPLDVTAAGRMAIVADPTGAAFALWQAGEHIGARLVNDPGSLCLNQLNTNDPERAQEFYRELFGWSFAPVGTDEQPYWAIRNPTPDGPALNGGMMPLPPEATWPSHWLSYFTTADLDASVAQIQESGGTMVVAPRAIESGRIAAAVDPQGAAFALFEGRVDP